MEPDFNFLFVNYRLNNSLYCNHFVDVFLRKNVEIFNKTKKCSTLKNWLKTDNMYHCAQLESYTYKYAYELYEYDKYKNYTEYINSQYGLTVVNKYCKKYEKCFNIIIPIEIYLIIDSYSQIKYNGSNISSKISTHVSHYQYVFYGPHSGSDFFIYKINDDMAYEKISLCFCDMIHVINKINKKIKKLLQIDVSFAFKESIDKMYDPVSDMFQKILVTELESIIQINNDDVKVENKEFDDTFENLKKRNVIKNGYDVIGDIEKRLLENYTKLMYFIINC